MKTPFRFLSEIAKVEEQSDGTLKVYGVASSGALDADGEITDPASFKAALPEFFKSGPALREMHQKIAAGKVLEANVDEQGVAHIVAHVVDAGSVAKVRTGVLRAFSWAGTMVRKGNTLLVDKIKEISLVDRGSNPEALIEVWKAEAEKSLYDVSRLASIVQDLAWLASDAAWSDMIDGDDPTISNELKTAARSLADTLAKMIPAEIAEVLGDEAKMDKIQLDAAVKAETASLTARIGVLEGENRELATKVATAATEAAKKAKEPDEASKALTSRNVELTEKVASLQTELAASKAQSEELATQGAELVSRLHAKGVLKAVAVAKHEDGPDGKAGTEKAEKDKTPVDLIRESLAAGEALAR